MLKVQVRKRLGDFELDACFEAPSSGTLALFGRSGSGKTTLISILAGLASADTGSVRLDDALLFDSAARINVPAERRRIGYVFQDARLFPHLTVAGNLQYALRRARGSGIGFDEVIDLLGLRGLLERRTHRLSGGERQRVAIGRALLSQPRLLLLDEPLASLDAARRAEVLPYLEALGSRLRLPMVYVSHEFDEIRRLANHVVLLEGGRAVAQGPLAQMSLSPPVRAIIGADQIAAIVEGRVFERDAAGLTRVAVGDGELHLESDHVPEHASVRVQVLARDVIIATESPRGLSVRNVLKGVIRDVQADGPSSDLVFIDVGGVTLLARITRAACVELGLAPQRPVWALIKSVSLRAALSVLP